MAEDQSGMKSDESESRITRVQVVLLIELFALAVALVTPITPSKTGSRQGLAELFLDDPSYLEEVGIYFLCVNGLIGLLAIAVWVYTRATRSRTPS